MEQTIVGIFPDRAKAKTAINDLLTAGIIETNVSYIYSTEGHIVAEDGDNKDVGGHAASGAGSGAILGGLAGLAVANGILPGLGALFVAGPLATALGLTGVAATTAAGAMTGAAAGGLIGALTGLGVDESQAKVYEEKVKLGGVLVAAKTSNTDQIKEIFTNNGAEEISIY